MAGFVGIRSFLPIHVYDTATGRPVAIILRPGKTPSGAEVRGHLRRIVRRIRAHWPTTKITIRGDGHYGRREVMDWCEDNGLDYVFGLSGNRILAAAVEDKADDIRTRRALKQMLVLRGKPHQTCARHRLSAGCTVPRSGRRIAAGRPLNDGAETTSARPRAISHTTPTRSKVPIDPAKTRIAELRPQSGRE